MNDRASPAAPEARARAARRITLLGAAVDGALACGKLAVGILASSQALIADGVHSLSDLLTDTGVLVITRISNTAPDSRHPYGHARFETLGTLGLGAVLLVVAGGLAQDSLLRLIESQARVPGIAALLMAAVSILAKEWIYRLTRRVAQEIGSGLLLANAWHSRSDALSSVAVLIGVGGAIAGWPWLDLVAALAVAGMIGWIGWGLLARAARELVDTGLPAEELARMRLAVHSVPGVLDVHRVRSRNMGDAILIDLDILVAPELTVSEGHQVAWQVQRELGRRFPEVHTVQVHVDSAPGPTDDTLPLRNVVEGALMDRWRALLPSPVERMALHYGDTGVRVELFLVADAPPPDVDALRNRLRQAAGGLDWFADVTLWWAPSVPRSP